MAVAAYQFEDLSPDDIEVVVDESAAPNDGLIDATARLLIHLYRKRMAREKAHQDGRHGAESAA